MSVVSSTVSPAKARFLELAKRVMVLEKFIDSRMASRMKRAFCRGRFALAVLLPVAFSDPCEGKFISVTAVERGSLGRYRDVFGLHGEVSLQRERRQGGYAWCHVSRSHPIYERVVLSNGHVSSDVHRALDGCLFC